jgi:hypothetical protein
MNRSWKVGQSRTFVDGERITVYRETQPGCHEVLMRDKHGPVVFSCRADAQAVADAINAAAPEPPAPGVGEEGAQNWQGMDGAIAFHLIDRHAEGWNQVGEMMEAWRAANTPAPSAGVSVSEVTPAEIMAACNTIYPQFDHYSGDTRADIRRDVENALTAFLDGRAAAQVRANDSGVGK